MSRRPQQTNAPRPRAASSTPPATDGSPQSASQPPNVDPQEDLPASDRNGAVSTPASATPLRELLDAALHPKADNPAKDSSSRESSSNDSGAGDSGSADGGSADVEVPRNRRERRSKAPRDANQPDRSYPSQTSLGRNGFARNPRRSPTRRQG